MRGLIRAPVFSLSVILTIGIGVGLNTSVFTIFNAYVLRIKLFNFCYCKRRGWTLDKRGN